jgi:hypothetical protein
VEEEVFEQPDASVEVVPDALSPQIGAISYLLDAIGLPRIGQIGHEADDVQHHSIVSTSLIRSESAWMAHFLRLVALAKQESRLAFCGRHGLAQSPRR